MSDDDDEDYIYDGEAEEGEMMEPPPSGRRKRTTNVSREAIIANIIPSTPCSPPDAPYIHLENDSSPDHRQPLQGGTTATAGATNHHIITKINDLDVLKGRGSGANNHFGNQNLIELVESLKHDYELAPKFHKCHVVKRVWTQIRQQGGRFLQPVVVRPSDSSSGSQCGSSAWIELPKEVAFVKINECFRARIRMSESIKQKKTTAPTTFAKRATCNPNEDASGTTPPHNQQPPPCNASHKNGSNIQRAEFELDHAMANNSSRVLTPERNQHKNDYSNTWNDSLAQDKNPISTYQNDREQQSSASSTQNPPQTCTETMQWQLIQVQTQAAEAQLVQHQQQQKHQNWKSYIDLSEKAIALEQKIQNVSNPLKNKIPLSNLKT